ncbi:MAG: NrsF family protein [Myxococcota bacterium]
MDLAKQLERTRAEDSAATTSAELDALWQRIEPETVGARRSWRSRLRELSTPKRVGLVLLGTIALSAIVMIVLGGMRGDLASGGLVARYALALLGLCVLAGAVFAVALRGAHQRPLGVVGWVIVSLAVVVPLALSLLPSVWTADGGRTLAVVDGCNVIGCTTGLFAGVLAWLFQRSTTPVTVRVLASAAGGGVIAFAMLQLHCPADNVEHLLLGHSIVGVILVAAAGLGLGIRRVVMSRRRS